jgi:Concanavalin A-like lectin/glucanases superfamily
MGYSTPVLSGSIPNPATQPLTGVLTWTQSNGSNPVDGDLLLHFDGTNGSSLFPDSSGNNNTVTSTGPTVTTTNPKFGTGSGFFGNTPQQNGLTVPTVSGGLLDLTGDFTIEFWILFTDSSAFGGNILADFEGGESKNYWNMNSGGLSIQMNFYANTTEFTSVTPTTTLVTGTWYSIAFVMHGGVLTGYLNGSSTGGAPTTISGTPDGTSGQLVIGGLASYLNGCAMQMDELRITQSALYTSNYTPATAPFSDGGGSVPATGYDIYRDGVSIAIVGQVLTYTDNVPSAGTYTYNVAAYVDGADASPLSNGVTLTYAGAVIGFPTCIFDEAIFGAYFGGQLNLVEFTYMPGRTPFEEGATNLIINRYKQEPTDVRQRGVDFTQFVVPGELLQTVSVVGISAQTVLQADTNPLVTPLVVSDLIIDPVTQLKFGYTVQGGQDGIEYTVQFATTTNIQSQTLEEIFSINIMIEDMFP